MCMEGVRRTKKDQITFTIIYGFAEISFDFHGHKTRHLWSCRLKATVAATPLLAEWPPQQYSARQRQRLLKLEVRHLRHLHSMISTLCKKMSCSEWWLDALLFYIVWVRIWIFFWSESRFRKMLTRQKLMFFWPQRSIAFPCPNTSERPERSRKKFYPATLSSASPLVLQPSWEKPGEGRVKWVPQNFLWIKM